MPHPLALAGRSAEEKRQEVAAILRAAQQDAAVITDPASLAWLLNLRGGDVPFTPFALGFVLLHQDGAAELFMAGEKLSAETRSWLGNAVSVAERAALPDALARLAGKRVRVDPAGSPAWFAQRLRARRGRGGGGARSVPAAEGVQEPGRSRRMPAARIRRDAVAVCRFLHFLAEAGPLGRETEMSAAARLLAFRQELEGFRGESFPAISGAGEHGAIIHYRVTEETDRPLNPDELYLCDSGAQFPEGTTDITRTVWTGPGAPPAARAGPLYPRAAGADRARDARLSAGRRRPASRRLRPPRAVGRRGSISTTAPGTASAAISPCTRGR